MKTKMGKYLCEFEPSNPRATKEGYVYTHVLVAEKKLGRYLKPEECVHHIDENKYNNNPDNIMVFRTIADHTAYHQGVPAMSDNDVWFCPTKGAGLVCPICLDIKDRKAPMCRACSNKRKQNDRINNHVNKTNSQNLNIVGFPAREMLKSQIRDMNFEEIGRIYGVTGNTIKKWCDKYELPRHQHTIKLIPDQEWETEVWSEETITKINEYYNKIITDDEIVETYCRCPNLRKTCELFHKDKETIRNILINYHIKVLSSSESGNIRVIDMYNENGEKVNSFLTLMDAAKWILSNGYGGNNHKAKKVSYLISKHLDTGKIKFGFIWKVNDTITNYKDYLIA